MEGKLGPPVHTCLWRSAQHLLLYPNSVFGLYVCVFLVRARVLSPGGPPSVGSGRGVAERGASDVVLGESGHIKGLQFGCNRWINTQMLDA